MKERLVEDWLTRINERGYEVPFCQTLASKGFRVLRCGHSPTEHGKDVLAISPDGQVFAYQLKSGDIAQADVTKHIGQLHMLMETRPSHPALPTEFVYRPVLVTTGEYKDPAISLIKELNDGWAHRNLPRLEVIGGRQLHADFVNLSADFWPIESPEVREFRELYLVDGRGDFEVGQFAKFVGRILKLTQSVRDLERRSAAANLFTSYLLGPFYERGDHWSVFEGWTVCAAAIAHTGEAGEFATKHWMPSVELAKAGALTALRALRDEVLSEGAFRVYDRELDDYTRVRNTTAVAAATCCELIDTKSYVSRDAGPMLRLINDFVRRGRFFFWGEGAFAQFTMLIWFLNSVNLDAQASALLLSVIRGVAERNAPDAENPFADPYVSADDVMQKAFGKESDPASQSRRMAMQSYTLFPLVLLAVRRNARSGLEGIWRAISHVRLNWFRPESPPEMLCWHCDNGKECDAMFEQPQSWSELCEVAFRDDQERLPAIIREDTAFALMFSLAFPHRVLPSLTKYLDSKMCVAR